MSFQGNRLKALVAEWLSEAMSQSLPPWTDSSLARASAEAGRHVGRETIWRLRHGKSEARDTTVERLAATMGVAPPTVGPGPRTGPAPDLVLAPRRAESHRGARARGLEAGEAGERPLGEVLFAVYSKLTAGGMPHEEAVRWCQSIQRAAERERKAKPVKP